MKRSFASRLFNDVALEKLSQARQRSCPDQRYSAPMKNLRVVPLFLATLLASLISVPNAAAQDTPGPTTNELPVRDELVAARSQYIQNISPDGSDGKTLAQLPRSRAGMATRPRHGYNRGDYQNSWISSGDWAHPLIGAAIGFGFGTAMGALSSIHNQTPVGTRVLIGGSLFAMIGGAIGASHGGGPPPLIHRRRFYRPSWYEDEDDEEGNLRSPSESKETQKEPSVSRTPGLTSQPAGVGTLLRNINLEGSALHLMTR